MVKQNKRSGKKHKPVEKLDMTLKDIYGLFYILVRQNQAQGKDNVLAFPEELFETLPKSPKIQFIKKDGCLIATIPEDSDDFFGEKSDVILPDKSLILKG